MPYYTTNTSYLNDIYWTDATSSISYNMYAKNWPDFTIIEVPEVVDESNDVDGGSNQELSDFLGEFKIIGEKNDKLTRRNNQDPCQTREEPRGYNLGWVQRVQYTG